MKCFKAFIRQAFYNTSVYRFSFWMQLIYCFIAMYSVKWIWQTLYAQSPGVFDIGAAQMATYGMLSMALELIFFNRFGPNRYMAQQVRTGAIDTDLLKPMNFQNHMLARNLGEILFRFITLVLPACIAGVLIFGMQLPATPLHGVLFIFSLMLAYLVLFSLNFLLGLLAMVTINITYLTWAYAALTRFFAGQLVPLWLFPDWLARIAEFLPFRCINAIPLSIYIGRESIPGALQGLLLQAFWALALYGLGHYLWSRVHRRLCVQGG